MAKIEYHMDKICQIISKQIGTADKMMHFWWITNIIAINREEVSCVVCGSGVNPQKIAKDMLNFKEKAWWTLDRHRLCPTTGDNILNLVWTILLAGLMVGYEFDIVQFIFREICGRALGVDKVILAFPCLAPQICLEVRVPELSDVDHYIEPNNITDLGLIGEQQIP